MGLPLYLFKKQGITFHQRPWQHVTFYLLSLVTIGIVYKHSFFSYFNNFPSYYFLLILVPVLFWFIVPMIYRNDWFSKKERFNYQLSMFFNIVFQQFCFLGGLLTFGVSPLVFGFVFFIIHLPFVFFVQKKFAILVTVSSLAGGLIFAYLQSLGVYGFLVSLTVQLLFWSVLHFSLSIRPFLGIVLVKR